MFTRSQPDRLDAVLRDLAERDPDVLAAVADVDRDLVREALERTPLERVEHVAGLLAALRKFHRVEP